MSGVYLAVCHSCSYSEGFKFGIGAKFSCLNRAACLIHPARHSQIQGILKINGLSDSEFGYRAFHCPTCSNLCDGFWVRIEHENSKVYETEFGCKRCGEMMISVSEPEYMKVLPCPDCKKANLELIMVMPWD
jgi:hypothetical protein